MSYADAWSKWFDVIEGGASVLSAAMIHGADLSRAKRVLDIGTGLGEPAITAARSLSFDGRVTAIDSDPRMIALARERAKALGLNNIDFLVDDAESTVLPDAHFDAVLARWSLMFVSDKLRVLRKLAATLRPGGRLVAGLWRDADRVPGQTLAERAIYEHFGWSPQERPERMAFSMADEYQVKGLFEEAGLSSVSATPCEIVYCFDTPRSYIQYRRDVSDVVWNRMVNKSEADWNAAFQAIERKMEPYLRADGRYHVVSHAYWVSAQVPDH